jgi:hypothetical protein
MTGMEAGYNVLGVGWKKVLLPLLTSCPLSIQVFHQMGNV